MAYADCFVLPIKKSKLAAYRKMAKLGQKAWRKLGALDYKEVVADDLKNPFGKSFGQLLRLKPSETAVVAWITFKSKAHRHAVNKKVHAHFASLGGSASFSMPFDPKKMAYGGFKVMVG